MKTDFIPIDYEYFDFQGKNFCRIIGRNSEKKRICVIDSCDVYLWAILKENLKKEKIKKLIEKISKIQIESAGRKTKVEKVEEYEKKFLGKKISALKIFATNYKDLHDIADKLDFEEIEKRRGYDLGYITHYLIEKKILPLQWYEIHGEVLNNSEKFNGINSALDVDFCIELSSAKEIKEKEFHPKVLAFDIETDEIKIGGGEILMISLVGENFKKVLTWKKTKEKKPDFVEYVKDEEELLEMFSEQVKKFSPDFLIGYFSDRFDLAYIKARSEKLKVKIPIGIDGSQPKFSRGNELIGKINGIVHIDILKFIKTAYSQYMQSETLSLNEVAKEFLGDSKKEFKIEHSSKLKEGDWNSYYEYNLHDSVLTFKLFEKMWSDLVGFTKVLQEPIFEISRNGMSKNVEAYIIHHLEKFNEIPEKRPGHDEIATRRTREKYQGAFVFEPIPGMYENIAMFDFTSSYGSVIVTYNLSKSTLLEKPEKNSHSIEVLGKKVYFSRKIGFVPEILKEIIELRKQFKKELKEKPDIIKKARSNAYKLLANAYYGYQGFFGARYYCLEAAAASAGFARKAISEVIEKINKEGYKVIYSDTDSIAFVVGKKSSDDVLKFLKKLNSELPGIMELELEGIFKRGIWVTTRAGTAGAKKKYALISEENKLKIRGFETVRRDWCQFARKTQNKIIELILKDGNEINALEYLKEIISKLKQRKISKQELIIKTQLKKEISDYKAISPHVIAAKKMNEQKIPISQGGLVEYYIAETKTKSKLIRDKVKLPEETGEYDIKYYLERQILQAVENIFQVFKVDVKEIIDGKRQENLGKWF